MTLAEARRRVDNIREIAWDDENAHGAEDHFHREVLAYLAQVAPAELGELARIALATREIAFCRWTA